jgi:hypothetical protein
MKRLKAPFIKLKPMTLFTISFKKVWKLMSAQVVVKYQEDRSRGLQLQEPCSKSQRSFFWMKPHLLLIEEIKN